MIKILDKDEVKEKEIVGDICIIKKDDVDKPTEKKTDKKNIFNFIAKDKIMRCERSSKLGLTNNCVICQYQNVVIFEKCQNKWV